MASIIQPSDFIGELQIANKSQDDVSADLTYFINKYEPRFLKALFGMDFYTLFMGGILSSTALPPTVDLTFTATNGFTINWQTDIVAGGSGKTYAQLFGNNPNPTLLFGNDANGYTPSIAYHVNRTGNEVTTIVFDFGALESGYVQFDGQVPLSVLPADYVYMPSNRFTDLITPEFRMMIASYIYYWYIRDQVTQTVGIGNVITAGQNATRSSGGKKMSRAWNEMVISVYATVKYLTDNSDIYPEYIAPNWLIWLMNDTFWWTQDYYLYPIGFSCIPDIFISINDMNI